MLIATAAPARKDKNPTDPRMERRYRAISNSRSWSVSGWTGVSNLRPSIKSEMNFDVIMKKSPLCLLWHRFGIVNG